MFHRFTRPSVTGMFFSKGAFKKCWSMSLAPSRNCSITPKPYCSERGSMPTALHTLYRPPTQSQNSKMLSGSIPNCVTSFVLVETATMCLETASSPSSEVIHLRTVRAFSIVSAVVKVLETITTMVVSWLRPLRALATSTGSTFARKRSCLPWAFTEAAGSVRRAVCTKRGPRKLPPMPMATTLLMGLPVAPSHSPLRTALVKCLILSRTRQTSSTTFLPSTISSSLLAARVAVWSTLRCSVSLICSPENMAWIFSRRPASSASSKSRSSVLGVTLWREKSAKRPLCSNESLRQRSSSLSRYRRCCWSTSRTCISSLAQLDPSEIDPHAAPGSANALDMTTDGFAPPRSCCSDTL
mmetsp:Transcript_18462/g.38428  ORF Transcript_18462/g.38428 Transcript_18462/m.38428 type:complete len:355 (+) Transcript_18462:858-1922(+)